MPTPTYADMTAVRGLFQRMREGWPDPARYAAGLAPDADQIAVDGSLSRGRAQIERAHAGALSGWAGGSALTGRIDRLQFLGPDVALLTAYGDITFSASSGAPGQRTIETVTAQRVRGGWTLVGCQFTPLGAWPAPRAVGVAVTGDADGVPASAGEPPSDADAALIRALYRQMLDRWLDAPAYAECFTYDSDYVTGGGRLERGWQENVEGHQIIFSAWARDSHLAGRIEQIRRLGDDVAVVVAYGHIVFDDDRPDSGKRTVYSLIARKVDGSWVFAGYQNTPIIRL